MIAPRRFLPSISSLLALEAVERLGTASAVAEELSLTHSAVSRQLKVLEGQIGVRLLQRDGKGLSLTPAGTTYAQSVRVVLGDLARASLRVRAGGSRDTLTLAMLPSFGTYWLLPRLRAFNRAHPDILINLHARPGRIDFAAESFDAAIHYGAPDWPGMTHLHLAGDRVIPATAPETFAGQRLPPADLLDKPLLHLDSRPGAWEEWFAHHGLQVEGLRGMLFDQFTTMAEAAAQGFGTALLPEFLAEASFSSGKLVPAAADYMKLDTAYYLVMPENRPENPQLDLLADFLTDQRQAVSARPRLNTAEAAPEP